MRRLRRRQVLGGALAAMAGGAVAITAARHARAGTAAALSASLTSDLDITGVVTRHGRTFACVQTRGSMFGPQVVEFVGGQPRPYPDADWNGWTEGADGSKAFVGVAALRLGQDHALWVVDRGAPGIGEERVFGAAKVVRIDLESNRVTRVYDLADVTKGDSLPSQIRFNGLRAYVADAGWPGIIVLKIETGEARRVLTQEAPLQAARPVRAGGHILRGVRGRMIEIASSLIEVAPDGDILYVQPAGGPMARIPTRFVDDASLPPGALAEALTPFADTPSSWGTAMDADGVMYVADIDRARILKVSPRGRIETLIADPRLAFVAGLWIDDSGNLLAPAARLNETGAFGAPDTAHGPFTVWSYPLGAQPLRR
jgi:hypothetical protein